MYLNEVLEPDLLSDRIAATVRTLSDSGVEFDSIVFSGYSGALVAPAVCARLGKFPAIVRKEKEDSHGERVEYFYGRKLGRYVIVDDFIETGATIKRIVSTISKDTRDRIKERAELVGVLLWKRPDASTDSWGDLRKCHFRKTPRTERVPVFFAGHTIDAAEYINVRTSYRRPTSGEESVYVPYL